MTPLLVETRVWSKTSWSLPSVPPFQLGFHFSPRSVAVLWAEKTKGSRRRKHLESLTGEGRLRSWVTFHGPLTKVESRLVPHILTWLLLLPLTLLNLTSIHTRVLLDHDELCVAP